MQSVPSRGSGWVRSLLVTINHWLRTHPLPRGGTDCIQVMSLRDRFEFPDQLLEPLIVPQSIKHRFDPN